MPETARERLAMAVIEYGMAREYERGYGVREAEVKAALATVEREIDAVLREAVEALAKLAERDHSILAAHSKALPANWVYTDPQTTLDLLVAECLTQRKELAARDALVERLRTALKSLRNEAAGFLSMASADAHGRTNIAVLKEKIAKADDALEALAAGAYPGAGSEAEESEGGGVKKLMRFARERLGFKYHVVRFGGRKTLCGVRLRGDLTRMSAVMDFKVCKRCLKARTVA